jgi:carbamoyltransferase
MRIAGTKYCGHDSAIAVLDTEKKEIFAMSTERVTRIKHDWIDITPILENYDLDSIDYVAHSYSDFEDKSLDGELRAKMVYNKDIEKALRKIIKPKYIKDLNISSSDKRSKFISAIFNDFDSIKAYYGAKFKRAFTKNTPENNRITFTNYILKNFNDNKLYPNGVDFYEHHLCHALPSYYFSDFNDKPAIALTLDGQGDGYFSKCYLFKNKTEYELIGGSEARYIGEGGDAKFTSIGRIYHYFTEAMGLRANSDEGKVEARAAFGKPDEKLLAQLKEATIIDSENLAINYDTQKLLPFYDIDWLKARREEIGDENFCAVVQTYLEDTMVEYLNIVYDKYQIGHLCLSGGVAANIIMSLNIYERTKFREIYVLPPMGDEGLAIGSAIQKAIEIGEDISWLSKHHMPYFGDSYTKEQVRDALEEFDNIEYEDLEDDWHFFAAKAVSEGKICAIFNGKMEFGPRALGNRSIIASPMHNDTRDRINSTVKRRPSYQPFCPSILEEDRARLFKDSYPHKHMAIAFRMRDEFIKDLPCAVHIDGTARPQFVEEADNEDYYKYLKELKSLTGYGVSLNTSFNLHGRTIVRTPQDAVVDFIDCNIDELFIQGFRVRRK